MLLEVGVIEALKAIEVEYHFVVKLHSPNSRASVAAVIVKKKLCSLFLYVCFFLSIIILMQEVCVNHCTKQHRQTCISVA